MPLCKRWEALRASDIRRALLREAFTIPNNVTYAAFNYKVVGIQFSAFEDNKSIRSVKMLSESITIQSEAFFGCTSLESIEIKGAVQYLGDSSFKNCINLKTIKFPKTMKTIDFNKVFEGCSINMEIQFEEGSIYQIENKIIYTDNKVVEVLFS